MPEFAWSVTFFDLGMTLVGKDSKKWAPGARDALQALLPPDFDWDVFETELIVLAAQRVGMAAARVLPSGGGLGKLVDALHEIAGSP